MGSRGTGERRVHSFCIVDEIEVYDENPGDTFDVSRTRKDSRKHQGTLIEIVKVDVDAFDLLLNHEVYRTRAPLAALPEWLCVRYGFCGSEYDAILEEVNREGRKTIAL